MRKLKGVWLIDDNETSNFLNQRLLTRMAIADTIRVFTNGKQAIEQLERVTTGAAAASEVKPELILLDVNMPVLDGFEFLERYQQLADPIRQAIVVAILSTSSHVQDTSRASAFKAHYILKPLTTEKLLGLITEKFAAE